MQKLKFLLKKVPFVRSVYYRVYGALSFLQFGLAVRVLLKGDLEGHPMHIDFIPRLAASVLSKDNFLLCDIGANRGVFSARVMKYCDDIEIIAFEPQRSNHPALLKLANQHPNFEVRKIGVGSVCSQLEFNQYSNDGLSSFKNLPQGTYGSHEDGENSCKSYMVEVSTLDKELSGVAPNRSIFVKIDVQGFEKEVLDGAMNLLSESRISGIFIELMTESKYDNDLYDYFINFLTRHGFLICDISPGFRDRHTNLMTEFDVLFMHKSFLEKHFGKEMI